MTETSTNNLELLDIPEAASANEPSTKQQVFLRYFTAIMIDLVVLNLFAEYWEHVAIDSFTISLLAAVLLQVLLKLTLMVEHQVGLFFKGKSGALNKFLLSSCVLRLAGVVWLQVRDSLRHRLRLR
jgi:hypothetical protein